MLNPFSVKYLIGELVSGRGSGLICFLSIATVFTSRATNIKSPPLDASEAGIRKELKVY